MKNFMAILSLVLFAQLATADCCCQPKDCSPKHCEEKPKVKYVTRTKVVEKVVDRPVPVIVEKPVKVVEKVVQVVDRPVLVKRTVEKKVYKKNRISVLAGGGPTRLSTEPNAVVLERGIVLGAQYQRSLNDTLSLGIQVQTNQTVLGSVGIDF
jgi:hypothetical protein